MQICLMCGNSSRGKLTFFSDDVLLGQIVSKHPSSGCANRDYGGIGRKKVVQQSSTERGVTPRMQPRKIGARNIFIKPKINHA